ncbi:MAG TPA: hypothetical protein VHU15_06680 [Stellaceae bacterium]|jgi:hypothetical protein|nr:hypothetical protein [Stellaceae bacterium]
MATDEELERAFGVPRPPSREHHITEDEWRGLMHALDRIDRRVGRLCNWSVTAIALAAAWGAGDFAMSHIDKGWGAAAIAFAAFLVVGMLGQRDLDRDALPAWLRRR